jgi:hypothetical protein
MPDLKVRESRDTSLPGLRLVRLQCRAAGTELLRLTTGVLELRASVRIDELSGLDSLEAVSF